ncbi:MAG: reverse transcriptase domain-containing protein [Clostridia bacterium]
MSTIFEKIIDYDNMYKAYEETQSGESKYKVAAMKFTENEVYNLMTLIDELNNGTYKMGDYTMFIVNEPKKRIIHAPKYRDKIVQVAINQVLKHVFNPKFIYSSYSCIDKKGTHACVNRIGYYLRKAKWLYGDDAYIVKLDIKKFFYSIDRSILKRLFAKKLRCARTLNLIYEIIDSADKISEKGLPLGNTISQLSANIYMNVFDQYCKRDLGINFYVRYADDIVVILENKEKAKAFLEHARVFVKEKLNIELNKKKSKIFPLSQGVNAIGFKNYPTHKLLRNRSKRNIKRKARKLERLLIQGKVTCEKVEQIFNSWKGHADSGCSHNFIKKLVNKHNYLIINNKGVFKVNKKALKEEIY